MQVYERGALGAMRYWDVVAAVRREAGLAGFYRGIGPEYMKVSGAGGGGVEGGCGGRAWRGGGMGYGGL